MSEHKKGDSPKIEPSLAIEITTKIQELSLALVTDFSQSAPTVAEAAKGLSTRISVAGGLLEAV